MSLGPRLLSVRHLSALMLILVLSGTALADRDRPSRNRHDRGTNHKRVDDGVRSTGSHVVLRTGRGLTSKWQRRLGRWIDRQVQTLPDHRPNHRPGRRWIEGRYEWKTEQVCVEAGHYERRWRPPVTETRYRSSGTPYTVVIREGYYASVWIPARHEQRRVKVWVPGRWVRNVR